MRHNYSSTGTPLLNAELDGKTLQNIGRMFRAVAEIEDIITLYLCALAKISEGHAITLLGRAPLSKKIDLARSFAKARGSDELEKFKATLGNEQLLAAFEFRNTIAHGALLGLTDEKRFAFRTSRQIDQDATTVTTEVNSYLPEEFQHCADALETAVPWLEAELKMSGARKNRIEKGLGAHTKAPKPAGSS